jgi:hypothetical protein
MHTHLFSNWSSSALSDLLPLYLYWLPTYNFTHHPEDGGSTDLWNASKLIPVYTALQPRRQPSSQSLPWEPQVNCYCYCSEQETCCWTFHKPGLHYYVTEAWTELPSQTFVLKFSKAMDTGIGNNSGHNSLLHNRSCTFQIQIKFTVSHTPKQQSLPSRVSA